MIGTPRLPGTVAEIDWATRGPQVGAFVDLDGTLIPGFSARYLTQDQIRHGEFGGSQILRSFALMVQGGVNEETFAALTELSAEAWRGRSHSDLEKMGERIFEEHIRESIYPEMRDIIEAHRRRGHTVVLCSSASNYQVEATARYLGVEHVICNRFLTEDGVLTGEVQRPVIYGPSKADVAQEFAAEHGIDLAASYFYADGDEDAPLMYLVGNPRPTNPGRRLAKAAEKRGWPVLRFTSRGGGVGRLARTVAGVSTVFPLVGMGVGLGLARRNKRTGINFVFEHFLDAMFAASKVTINVVGEENAWAQRPAVFLVNHRNTFDGAIAMRIVRKDFTALAKAEIGRNPLTAALGGLLDVGFVDRQDAAAAIEAMKPIEELARKGLSVIVAPEGTRTLGREIGPFKKGAFRIAMAADLPVIPIVLRDAEVIGGRNAFAMHPGTVHVAVLKPISVKDWTQEELGQRVEEVRQLYIETLANWPGLVAT